MKKQTVVLVWALAILLLVATCFVIIFVSTANITQNKSVVVFNCTSSKIEEYSVYDTTGKYTLEKEDGVWYVEDDSKAKLNQSAVEKMMAAASNITASGTISRKDLKSFDVSNAKTVRIDVDDGKNVEINFLGTSKNLCAFRISGDWKTYVMYEATRDILAPSLDALRIMDVFPKLVNTDTLPAYYKYTDYDRNVVEIREKTANELARGKNNRYMMVRPYNCEVDDDLFEQQIAVKIPAIKARSFVNNPSEDKSLYGLDKESRAELSFKWDNITETLYLGKNEGGAVFAMKKGAEDIFMIDSALVEFLQMEPFFVLDSGILKNESDKIVGVRITKGYETYDITAVKTKQGLKQYFINGKAASRYVFEEIIEDLGNMAFKNEISQPPKNTNDITITVNFENLENQRISLVKTSENSYAVFLNGKAEFEVDREYVDELLEEIKDALENPLRME